MEHVDALKGFIIIVVVFIHLVMLSGMNREGSATETALFLQVFYLGLMSFYIVSGYFFRPGRGFAENMKRRGIQLAGSIVVCSVVLPLVLYGWYTLCGNCPGVDDLWESMVQCFGFMKVFESLDTSLYSPLTSPGTGYYFLWSMLFAFVVFYAVADRICGDWRKQVAVIAVLLAVQCLYTEFVNIRLPMGIYLAPVGSAFMVLGMFLSERRILERIAGFTVRSWKYWASFAVALASGLGLVAVFHPEVMFDKGFFGFYGGYSVFPYFLEAGLMFIVFLYLMEIVVKVPVISVPFVEMGKHTLGTLLLHVFFAKMLVAPMYPSYTGVMPNMGLVPSLAVAAVTAVLCFVVCRFGPGLVSEIRERAGGRHSPA